MFAGLPNQSPLLTMFPAIDVSERKLEVVETKACESRFGRESWQVYMHVICEVQSKVTSRHMLEDKLKKGQFNSKTV